MYLNLLGILITFIASVIIRRYLNKYYIKLDETLISNSDYAVYGIDLPKECPKEVLKEKIEAKFGVKVVYVNYCYAVDEFLKEVSHLKELFRLKGIYNNFKERFIE